MYKFKIKIVELIDYCSNCIWDHMSKVWSEFQKLWQDCLRDAQVILVTAAG